MICAPEEGGNHPISGDQAMANGRPESMAFMAAANGARCIWPWTPPRLTSAPWNSPPSSAGDSPIVPELLDQTPEVEEIGTVTADGAYDTRRCHTAIIDRQATSIIPIRKNGLTGWSICKRRSFVDGHLKISGRFDHVKPSCAAF